MQGANCNENIKALIESIVRATVKTNEIYFQINYLIFIKSLRFILFFFFFKDSKYKIVICFD
jgi:hypothetical protein